MVLIPQQQQESFTSQNQRAAQFRNQQSFNQLQFSQQQFARQQQPQQKNLNQYGPPPAAVSPQYPYPAPADSPTEQPENNFDEVEEDTTETLDDNSTDQPAVAVSNANGQYYILTKDNTLQRVVYETAQTEDDRINNGFTAQLRYSLVEPIRDPIYAYNAQGQLIRVYNKK